MKKLEEKKERNKEKKSKTTIILSIEASIKNKYHSLRYTIYQNWLANIDKLIIEPRHTETEKRDFGHIIIPDQISSNNNTLSLNSMLQSPQETFIIGLAYN